MKLIHPLTDEAEQHPHDATHEADAASWLSICTGDQLHGNAADAADPADAVCAATQALAVWERGRSGGISDAASALPMPLCKLPWDESVARSNPTVLLAN